MADAGAGVGAGEEGVGDGRAGIKAFQMKERSRHGQGGEIDKEQEQDKTQAAVRGVFQHLKANGGEGPACRCQHSAGQGRQVPRKAARIVDPPEGAADEAARQGQNHQQK